MVLVDAGAIVVVSVLVLVVSVLDFSSLLLPPQEIKNNTVAAHSSE
jgi:hypothetical protein